MTDDIKPEVIKKTQDILGKHVKKPQLTEKLLRKPPFRFLHDIVTNVIKETGFLKGLYSEDELNHENIKDRESKIAFLDKLINCVKLATGASLSVKSTKIIAGLEPTRTNELLQAIGQGLDKKVDSSKAVQSVVKTGNKKPGASEPRKKEKPAETGSTASKSKASKHDKKDPSSSGDTKNQDPSKTSKKIGKDKKPEKQDDGKESKKRSSSNQRNVKDKEQKSNAKSEGLKSEDIEEKPSEKTLEKPRKSESVTESKTELARDQSGEREGSGTKPNQVQEDTAAKIFDLPETSTSDQKQNAIAAEDSNGNVKENTDRQRPVSALGRRRPSAAAQRQQNSSEDPTEPAGIPGTSASTSNEPVITKTDKKRTDSAAPSSARPSKPSEPQVTSGAAPIPLVRPRTAARQGSARPGAPRLRNRGEVALVSDEQVKPSAVNLIVETDDVKQDQDDDENLVVVESTAVDSLTDNEVRRPDSETVRPSSQQGQLVAQILETQKELESKVPGQGESSGPGGKVEINWEASRQRERGVALREVQRLCESIQTVTRAAHPIGKLLDSLQEDVDSMQRELEQWQSMQRSLEEQLLAEEALTVQSTQPLKEHLQQLQQAVQLQQDQLSTSKANIIANDQRIYKLLASGDSKSKQKAVFTM